MKVTVLGATGMLGNAVGQHMQRIYGRDEVLLTCRSNDGMVEPMYPGNWMEFRLPHEKYTMHKIPSDTEYVINCLGIIKPFIESTGVTNTILINSVFPHVLAEHCQSRGIKLININTDCVYSGKKGLYTEDDEHDCQDLYGMSKVMGESTRCMTLRTSIIGNEMHKDASLVAWAKSQAGKQVRGFTNHLWNGVTTNTYARICERIMESDMYQNGIFHVFSNIVNKCELLGLLSEHFGLELDIEGCEPGAKCDRTLATNFPLNNQLMLPSIQDQIKEL